MKFGVVEYSSKTGTVWRHHDDHPNFLADPQKEMDPTSFGCYVSALKGEHIPLLGLILGPVAEVSPRLRLWRRSFKKITRSWPANYSLDYFSSFDVLLVVHQISDGHEVTALTKRLRAAYPQLCIMGVPTQPYGILKQHMDVNPEWLADFKEFMSNCNVFISIVKQTVPLWQQLSRTPVVYLPQPYPTTYTQQFFKSRNQKQKRIFVAGVPTRDDIKRGYLVAQKIQEHLPEYTIHVTETPEGAWPRELLQTARYEILPFEQWREHLATLSQTSLVINTDYTLTRGRVQVDCAAVGTPSIGANSDGQVDLYPQLPADANTSVEILVEQGLRLLQEEGWYTSIARYAHQQLEHLGYEQSAARLRELARRH